MKQIYFVVIMSLFCLSQINAQGRKMKQVDELIDPQQTGWVQVQKLLSSSKNKIEILPKDSLRADSALYLTQLSTKSALGGIIYNCGGILIDNGWVRILGSGSKQLNRSLPQWNKGKSFANYGDSSSFLLIADDVVGGFFAINTGGLAEKDIDRVYYYGPNSLKWQPTSLSYSEFIIFCISDGLKKFYRDFRWTGWEDEIGKLDGNQVISCFPLLWTKEGLELKCNRKIVSVHKLWNMYQSNNKASLEKLPGNLSQNVEKK